MPIAEWPLSDWKMTEAPASGSPLSVTVPVTGATSGIPVGFAEQPFAFELVPREMMKDNPDGLDLATPSICFHVDDLEATRAALVARGVNATEVGDHHGMRNFAFSDPEGRWFAVTR